MPEPGNQPNPAHMKAAFLQLIATAGWEYFKKFADSTIRELDNKAINEDDEAKARTFRNDARGARKFWNGIQERMFTACTQNTEPAEDPADEFYAVVPEKNDERRNQND